MMKLITFHFYNPSSVVGTFQTGSNRSQVPAHKIAHVHGLPQPLYVIVIGPI